MIISPKQCSDFKRDSNRNDRDFKVVLRDWFGIEKMDEFALDIFYRELLVFSGVQYKG